MSAKLWEQALNRAERRAKAKRPRVLEKIRRFFLKKPASTGIRANRKGKGFHLFRPPAEAPEITRLRRRLMVGGGLAAAAACMILIGLGRHAAPDFTLPLFTLAALCGLIAYDLGSRRLWEKKMVFQFDKLCGNHDRLVREVARNRGDIATIREGLGVMAQSVEKQRSRLAPTANVEGKMIETIVTSLGALGEKPRAEPDNPAAAEILELEMGPPPSRPPPVTALDSELMPDFDKYSDNAIAGLVRNAVREDKVEIFLQPVVSLPARRPQMFEIMGRIRAAAGVYLPAERYLEMAAREDLVTALDNAILLRFLEILKGRHSGDTNTAYIVNVSCATLGDRGFMNDLVSFLSQNHKMAARLVFELPQKELDERGAALAPLLDGLSRLGCRFSMDRVRSRVIDIGRLRSLHIRYLKFDAGWLLKEGASHAGFSRIIRLKKQLDLAGIDLIAEHIEDEKALRELLDFGISYGQGYLFGKPDHHAAYRREMRRAA